MSVFSRDSRYLTCFEKSPVFRTAPAANGALTLKFPAEKLDFFCSFKLLINHREYR